MAHVTIVGGGLAGMVAALRLLERGCEVSLHESSYRLGGKAGANQNGEDRDEHGYHIFPAWYLNVWKLVDELGIRRDFLPVESFLQLKKGEHPDYKDLKNLSSPLYAWHNIRSGVLPAPEMFLFFYSILDLISQPYRYRSFLDRISVNAFIRSRFYRTERVARQHQDLLLKGISVPSYEVSAMTTWNVMRYWLRHPLPMHSVLRGDLQRFWIDPIERRLLELGCRIHLQHRLERIEIGDGRVTRLHFKTGEGPEIREVDQVLVAIPAEKMARLVGDELYAAAPALAGIHYLRSRSMAAFNLYLNRRLPNIPKDHVNLIGSRFGLSFIDISQIWTGYEGTVFNIIASDFTTLQNLSEKEALKHLIEDLQSFLPDLREEDIRRVDYQPHLEEPLFMNDIGAWEFRPKARTELPNLYLAGDYCRSHIDLVSMEGAVSTGLLAAEALREDLRLAPPVEIIVPQPYPRWLMFVLKTLLLPLAALAKLYLLVVGTAPEPEDRKPGEPPSPRTVPGNRTD